jgi:hypothetical protein
MKTNDELIAQQMADSAFRAEWERTALARAVALRLVRYRAELGLGGLSREGSRRLSSSSTPPQRSERGTGRDAMS